MRDAGCGLAFALTVALGLTTVTGADEDKKVAAARKDVLDLLKDVALNKDIRWKVRALRKKYDDLEPLMSIYKPRRLGGLGFGPKGKMDSIDSKIRALSKRA